MVVAVAAAVMLFKDVGDPAPPPAAARLKPPVLTLDRPVGGTLHFVASTAAGDERVYRLTPADRQPIRLTEQRTWHVSAWDGTVLVNTAAAGLDPAVVVDLGRGRTLASDAHTPTAGPGGAAAYTGTVQRGQVSAAFVRWGARGRFRPVVRGGISSTAFLPDGRLVVLHRRDARALVSVVGRRGVQRTFRVPGNPQHQLLVTRDGLIGFEGGTGTLRVLTPAGRRQAALDVEGWVPAGVHGNDFLLTERDGTRIASLTPAGDLEIVGRHDPSVQVSALEWELR